MAWNIRGNKAFIGSVPQKKAEMTASGITPCKKLLQDGGMDEELRSKLFSLFVRFYATPLETQEPPVYEEEQWSHINTNTLFENADLLMDGLVNDYIKIPVTAFSAGGCWDYSAVFNELVKTFQAGPWEDVYYLLTLVVKHYPNSTINKAFMNQCNRVLEEENSAYQFIAGRILPKMSDSEIKEVEIAASGGNDVSDLLNSAIDKLAQGDPKNAIKEAVSAVELLSNLISPLPQSIDLKKALPKALDRLEKELNQQYNPSLKDTFLKMYNYASSEPKIRHGSKARASYADEAEARFAVVTCSALINYLRTKADEAGIDADGWGAKSP